MKLSDSILNNGIFETLDRLCESTAATYSSKAKTADVNDALDWYCQLAFKADREWNFDDVNETGPPIDTQDLVSGTNRYKFSDFTETIFRLINLEILDDSGAGQFLVPETMNSLGRTQATTRSGVIPGIFQDTFQERYLNTTNQGTPTHYIKYGDYIYLYPTPNYSETGGLKAYFNRQAIQNTWATFTITIANPGVVTATSHGLSNGETVILNTTGALPTGISADTQYYVANKTDNTFELAASSGGASIETTGSQSGTHTFLQTNDEPGIPAPHHRALVRKAALTYLNYTSSPKVNTLLQQVLMDEQMINEYFSGRGEDIIPRMRPLAEDNR